MGFRHSGTKTCEQSTGSWKNFSLCNQLESNNGVSVGPSYSAGFPQSFQGGAPPNSPSSSIPTNQVNAQGSFFLAGERSGSDSGARCLGRGVLLDPLLGAQDGRSDEASHKPKSTEFLSSPPAFQDGEYPHTTEQDIAKLDLKDAYFTVPINQEHQKFLRFVVDQVRYQFTCLPFGLSCAPWAFTKVVKPVAAFLRSLGVRLIVYIDDILIKGKSPDEVRNHVEALITLLEGLGFIVNMEKSVLTPSQRIKFLGLQLDTSSMCLSLPGHKIRTIRGEAAQLLQQQHQCMQGSTMFPAPLFYRHLQRDPQGAVVRTMTLFSSCLRRLRRRFSGGRST